YILYRNRAVKWWFPIGVASSLLGLAAAVAGDFEDNGGRLALVGAIVLGLAAVIAILEIIDEPHEIFPTSAQAENVIRRQFRREQNRNPDLAGVDPFTPAPLDPVGIASILGCPVTGEISGSAPPATHEELVEMAARRGVGDLFQTIVTMFTDVLDGSYTTGSSLVITSGRGREARAVLALHPAGSGPQCGLMFSASPSGLAARLGRPLADILAVLPPASIPCEPAVPWLGHHGYLHSPTDLDGLLTPPLTTSD
ncbi:MAG: hypothetical protein ACRDZM_14270, partial [Acidimicrobiia bacterium]